MLWVPKTRKRKLQFVANRQDCSAALIRNFPLPFYLSILAVSLIACIIWYRLITFDITQSVPCTAESSFGDSLNFILLLWVLFARFFWFGTHFIPFVETCSRKKIRLDWLAKALANQERSKVMA
jgi:hypothetical protein